MAFRLSTKGKVIPDIGLTGSVKLMFDGLGGLMLVVLHDATKNSANSKITNRGFDIMSQKYPKRYCFLCLM